MNSFTKYCCSQSEDNDEYTTEEIARHKKFVWNLNTTKKVNFMDFPRDVRNRVYRYALEQSPTEPMTIRLEKDNNFNKPRTTANLGLSLQRTCEQVKDEVQDMVFSRVFKFSNLDVLLAFLVKSTTARRCLRRVDIQLESGPFDLGEFALPALSELNLHTLTLRCHAVEGPEEHWTRSTDMNLLLQTRGVGRVTLGPVDQHHHLDVGSLTSSSELGQKLITLLQRPIRTPRRDPRLAPIMSDDVIEQPDYPCLGYSVTDFEELEDEEPSDFLIPDPLCVQHEALWWCDCIGHGKKRGGTPEDDELHWSQRAEKGPMLSP